MLAHRVRKAAQRGAKVAFLNPARFDYLFPVAVDVVSPPAQWVADLAGILAAALEGTAPKPAAGAPGRHGAQRRTCATSIAPSRRRSEGGRKARDLAGRARDAASGLRGSARAGRGDRAATGATLGCARRRRQCRGRLSGRRRAASRGRRQQSERSQACRPPRCCASRRRPMCCSVASSPGSIRSTARRSRTWRRLSSSWRSRRSQARRCSGRARAAAHRHVRRDLRHLREPRRPVAELRRCRRAVRARRAPAGRCCACSAICWSSKASSTSRRRTCATKLRALCGDVGAGTYDGQHRVNGATRRPRRSSISTCTRWTPSCAARRRCSERAKAARRRRLTERRRTACCKVLHRGGWSSGADRATSLISRAGSSLVTVALIICVALTDAVGAQGHRLDAAAARPEPRRASSACSPASASRSPTSSSC